MDNHTDMYPIYRMDIKKKLRYFKKMIQSNLCFQYANPDLPLGSAEQFLLTLASINELSSRLKLWVFKLDFDNLEVSL